MQRPSPTEMMKQRDEELDKKIVALRRKNEALMKRYQEVEEDKKKAEQEGMALQSRKSEELSITINKTTNQEPRVVMKKAGSGGGSPQDKGPKGGGEAADGGPNQFSMGRGKRRQLFVTMVGNNKGTRVVSESADPNPQRPGGIKISTEDEEENCIESSRRGRHCQSRKRTSQTQEDGARQEGQAAAEESHWLSECDPYYQDAVWLDPPPLADLTIPTSREEQLEYTRWKAEREQIDRDRVARHQNAKGQWRRAWDLDKPQLVFSDKTPGETERPHSNRGGRAPRRGHPKSAGESQGQHGRGRDRKGKNSPSVVVGSKAKGKDRLTGRARRWDIKDTDEDNQPLETSLEEFLEELDALCDPDNPSTESDAPQNSDGTAASAATDAAADDDSGAETGSVSLKTKQTDASSDDDDDTDKRGNAETASPKGTEKKVRFSEKLVQGAHVQRNLNVVVVETKGSLLKGASLQTKTDVSEAEPDSTTVKPQPSQPQQQQAQQQTQQLQQTEQQEEETDSRHQEDQDTRHLSPTSTEDCSPAAPAQEAQEEKADNEKEQVKETDNVKKETEKEEDKQPDGEAQKPPHSMASEMTEAAESVLTVETEGEASTTLHLALEQQAPEQQAPEKQAPEQQAPEQKALEQQAPEQLAPEQQAPEQQAPEQQAPEQKAPEQQAPEQQAPEQQAPEQKAPEQQAPDQQVPEQQAPEQQAPEQQAPEQQAPDQQAPEQQAPDQQAPDRQDPDQQAHHQQAHHQQAPDQKVPEQQAHHQQAPDQQAHHQQSPDQQAPEQTKTTTSRVTEELIDSSLSVLSLNTGDAHPDHVTSKEKAREDGKVV